MRLLDKDEIQSIRFQERKTEIEQGGRLAKQVDELINKRESEEKELETFRTTTVNSVSLEIKAYSDKRNTLISEVRRLEEQKAILMIPITDLIEKNSIIRDELELKTKEINDQLKVLKQNQISVEERRVELDKVRDSLIKQTAYFEQSRSNAMKVIRESELEKGYLSEKLEEYRLFYNSKSEEIVARETYISNTMISLGNRESSQNEREIELNNKERAITDKYQTLERTINRLENGRRSKKRSK